MELNWNAVVEEIGPRLYRYFHARFSKEEAADLTQETLIRLVRKIRGGGFQPDKGSLRMYAFGIAHFVAYDAHKNRFVPELLDQEPIDESVAPDEILIGKEEGEVARKALKKLSVVQREILILMIDEEISLSDISILLGMPVGTLKSHVFRAKQRLRQILTKERESL